MDRTIVALAVAVFATASQTPRAQTPATPAADVMAVVHQFVDGFNKGDQKMLVSACADQVSIIDEFPPHEWHGVGSCEKWSSDFDADARKNGITDGLVTLSKPSHVDVSGDHAYVVVPANYAYKMKGQAISEAGSVLTIALHKGATGWRITGWAWAKH